MYHVGGGLSSHPTDEVEYRAGVEPAYIRFAGVGLAVKLSVPSIKEVVAPAGVEPALLRS